ncbi:hypothetical protein T492DRAFT_1091453 [Pavlovales sp. CCMP2436]|nr:hypothetical protein T492DRAFT_1091453 [Pavlovales sp. CCMP2436]
MPAQPELCLVFASEEMVPVAEVLAQLLPKSCVVFGAVSRHGVIGTSSEGITSEMDQPSSPLISVTLVHLAGTRLHPFFQPQIDPHVPAASAVGDPPIRDIVSRSDAHRASGAPGALTSLLLLADAADSVLRGSKLVDILQGGKGIPILGALVERDTTGTLLLRAPQKGLRTGLRRVGMIGLFLEGGHTCMPAITRGAALLSPDEWTVSETDSTSRAVCPGHEVSQHVVKRLEGLARENGDSTRSTTPLQVLHTLAAELPKVEVGELCGFASVTAKGSEDELTACAEAAKQSGRLAPSEPLLCLSFVCCGRRFYEEENRETLPLRLAFRDLKIGGFFAAGEIGPRPFGEAGGEREDESALMGFTSVHALLHFHGRGQVE